MKVYEATIILLTSLREEKLTEVVESIRTEIDRCGGSVRDVLALGRRSFSRPMGKEAEGNYYRVVFEMDPAKLDDLRARFRLTPDIFRVMIEREYVAPKVPEKPEPVEKEAGVASEEVSEDGKL